MVYAVLCMLLTRITCFCDMAVLVVGFGIDVIWITASLYAAARAALHSSRLGTALDVKPGVPAPELWPYIGLDRVCFPLQFGVVGSFPWRAGVSEESALNCFQVWHLPTSPHISPHLPTSPHISMLTPTTSTTSADLLRIRERAHPNIRLQAMLFFQLFSLTEDGVTLLFGTPGSSPYNALITSQFPLFLVVISKLALVLLWAMYILPRLMVSFALPPFVTLDDEDKLFTMLTQATKTQKAGVDMAKKYGGAFGAAAQKKAAGPVGAHPPPADPVDDWGKKVAGAVDNIRSRGLIEEWSQKLSGSASPVRPPSRGGGPRDAGALI